jgi:MFS family permease
MKVLGAVWLPGFGSALSSVGFGAMIAFSSLLSAERGLSPLWLTFSAFAIALVAARLFLGHTPDKLGGAKVALVCVFIEAGGLALIWFASNPVLAAAGAALTGFGYSLVYPGLGVEAVRRAPPQSRGLAMGAYTVFLDVALGFSSPALGLIAGWTGLGSVFLASAILVLCAAVIAAWLLRKNSLKEKQSWGADYPPAKRNGKMGIPGVQRRQIGEQQRKSRPLLLLPQGAGPAGFCLHVGPDEDRELARQPFTKPGGSNEIHRRNTRNAVHACLGFGTGRSDQDARGRSHGCSRA